MPRKRGLGRGLDALIPGEPSHPSGLVEVPVEAILPNPHQPRTALRPESLEELAASIREHGLIQPLIVTRLPEAGESGEARYRLIAGERRWRAAQMAGLATVPAIVKEAAPREMLELALVENLQRADLNPLEEASAYRQLIEEFGLTQAEVAQRVGKSRVAVTNTLRLLKASPAVQEALLAGQIREGHARALLALESEDAQAAVLQTVVKQGLSVRQTEALVRRLQGQEEAPTRPTPSPPPEVQALEARLREALGTKVTLQRGKKGGRIVIHFYSDEELEALFSRLTASPE